MRKVSFCDGWKFSRNGGPFRVVRVPHDAMLDERRGPDAPAGSANGYFFGGVYRYRKTFTLSEAQAAMAAAGAMRLQFESVYRNAAIRVNDRAVEDVPPYGFTPFFVDLQGLAHAGENLIQVEVDVTAQPDLRWYSGAGLIRPVWLWELAGEEAPAGKVAPGAIGGTAEGSPVPFVPPEGIRITTCSATERRIRVDVEAAGSAQAVQSGFDLRVCVYDAQGGKLGERLSALRRRRFTCEMTLPEAPLWSPEDPALLTCVVQVLAPRDGRVLDETRERFGMRNLAWNTRGLFLNGRKILLAGGCIHHDNGPLGAVSLPEAERRRVAKLKSLGFTALRMAHNPASGVLLDICDELGMLVIDEAWDVWFTPKSAHDYAGEFLAHFDDDLTRMVRRDRNHPCVIMYSIGNEVADPITKVGREVESMMVELLHALDDTRPVTCGFNLTMMVMERMGRGWYADADAGKAAGEVSPANGLGKDAPRSSLLFNLWTQTMGTGMEWLSRVPGADALVSRALDGVDVAGYNYGSPRYFTDAKRHPSRLMLGTETYPHHLPANWRKVRAIPQLLGDFMWAAWDYLGEAGATAWTHRADEAGFAKPWPWISAGSGCFDLVGTLDAHGALARAVWRRGDGPCICVRPVNHAREVTYKGAWRGSDAVRSWSWAGCEGDPAWVEVYEGRATHVRLELNGREVATRRVLDCCARFFLPYEEGELVAVALDEAGRELGRDALRSARGSLHIGLAREDASAGWEPRADDGLVFVDVTLDGANGEVEANADEWLTARVDGGELVAFASGNPAQEEPFATPRCRTHYGRALAILLVDGPCTLTVEGETTGQATCVLGS